MILALFGASKLTLQLTFAKEYLNCTYLIGYRCPTSLESLLEIGANQISIVRNKNRSHSKYLI